MSKTKKDRSLYICVDFDGTCVTHDYPNVGKDIGAVPVLKELVAVGHKIIIYTMRSTDTLMDAIEWFNKNGIPFYAANQNPSQKRWTKSPKIYGNLYIDDASIYAPLTINPELSDRPFIDWVEVREELIRLNLIQ